MKESNLSGLLDSMPKRDRTPAPARFCSHCGSRISSRGRRSATGRSYCADKPDCRSAKSRDWYKTNVVREDPGDAPTACTNCGRELPARKIRRGDSPFGRWCRRAECQRHRENFDGRTVVTNPDDTATLTFLRHIEADAVQACPGCGLPDAVKGYAHPKLVDGQVARCETIGSQGAPLAMVKMRWPGFFS